MTTAETEIATTYTVMEWDSPVFSTETPTIAPREDTPIFTNAVFGKGSKVHATRVIGIALCPAWKGLPAHENLQVASHPECSTGYSWKNPGGHSVDNEITCKRCKMLD